MAKETKTIKIQNHEYGVILNETFVDPIQFKLFLKMVNGCLTTENDLTFFNGEDFLIHIPFNVLKMSVIVTTLDTYSLSDHVVLKSKIEQIA